jgi:hypothetical protein
VFPLSHSLPACLTNIEQYDHDRDRDILARLNATQERFANARGISTVWVCDEIGHYWALDTDDERYASITSPGQTTDRMVYRLAVAAANTHNPRDYSNEFLDEEEHFNEFVRAFTAMAHHNNQINQR